MADRIASPWWLRAEGASVHWPTVLRRQLARRDGRGQADPAIPERLRRLAERRGSEVHLRWAAGRDLGLPLRPWLVQARPSREKLRDSDAIAVRADGGLRLSWGFVAAHVEVTCQVADPSRAVALLATRSGGGTLRETVGADATRAPGGGSVTLRVRTSGATGAMLVNAHSPSVRCEALQDVLDGGWEDLELVGLPADDPWDGTAYQPGLQGLVSALEDPRGAALGRLKRGAPPVGWWPVTESGRTAPEWRPPDHDRLLEEARDQVLARLAPLFDPAVPSGEQRLVRHAPGVEGPSRGGRTSSLTATADLPLLSVLTLPAASDPHLALVLGFGTAYGDEHVERLKSFDFLVCGDYEDTPAGTGPTTVCAYVPAPGSHHVTPPPTALTAARAGLVAPAGVDEPWRESVRLSWDRPVVGAALGRPASAVLARFDPAGSLEAECLLPERDAGDRRPLLLVPDGAEGTPAHGRTGMTDAGAVIPLGSGGRQAGYPVAVQDVFGIWSRWEDVSYSGSEPGPPAPRVISVAMAAVHAGSTSCRATVTVELAVEWDVRTPSSVDLALQYFPMAAATSPPPPGLDPEGPAAAGGFTQTRSFAFAADGRLGAPGEIVHLDPTGEQEVGGSFAVRQGDARRYRIELEVPELDFAATARWGVQVWSRSALAAFGGAPSGWGPDPARPAVAQAASPVPVAPLLPPPLPGVPLGSTPDAEGRSHVRVRWGLPPGAAVQQCVVWEIAETALRQLAGLPQRAADGTVPGQRLVDLRAAYDGLSPTARRSGFRRLEVLPGSTREHDVALPKGSTDIHAFVVTTVTATGIESAWPDPPGSPHTALQVAMAPRLRRPAAPEARSEVQADGSVRLALRTTSRIGIERFLLHRTHSPVAARSAETMGPAFASVPATADGPLDPATGEHSYVAVHVAALPPSWDEWLLRAVAVPVGTVPAEAVRGLPSRASDVVAVTALPTGPPDLAPLTAELWGAASEGVVVRTSTPAPVRAAPLGSHRASALAGAEAVAPVALESVAQDTAAPPPGAAAGAVLLRGERAAGRTPLALWFTRADPSQPVDVVVRLADPLGRVREERITVPGFVPPAPEPAHVLELLDAFKIMGRGVVALLRTDAPTGADPAFALDVTVTPSRRRLPPGMIGPPAFPLRRRFALHDIPSRPPLGGRDQISATRSGGDVQLLVRVPTPFVLDVQLWGPNGAEGQVTERIS